ncbi:PREDICTED: uncharacterized protein LOC104701407 isoform X2 [Camelina sativa]|uniref:Uncharacterized protein LOC104701407 isoform X2 n=1 Tax=Camelina sativa TaxID=90675 RepID=A0ABM0SS77_CAMSA|nr:PREDICTED: uncharacterized protein LOC104701407 isoform X2 [Camelina sativa]
MLDAFLGSATEEIVAPLAQSMVQGALPSTTEVLSLSGEDKRVCKNLFPASENQNVTTRGVMVQDQQEDLFSAALSDLLDQEFPLPDTRELGGMAPILEEHGIVPELSSEENSSLAEEEVTFVTKDCGSGASQVQDLQGEAGSVAVEGDTTDIVQRFAAKDGVLPSRSKLVKNKGILPGASTKKRNLYTLASPRKKFGTSVSTTGVGMQGNAGPNQGGKPPTNLGS